MAPDVKSVSSLYGGFWNFDIQDFCYMTNRYFPPRAFLDSLGANLQRLVGSYPSTNKHLSSLVAESVGLTSDELVVGNGASEFISTVLNLRVEHMAIPIPAFDEYRNRAKTQGKRVSPFLMGPDFELDVDGFINHVQEIGANSVVIVRPNNPAGTLVSRPDMLKMLQAFEKLDLVLVDESFLYFAGADYLDMSVMDQIHAFPNLVIVNSMSKAYGVPGLRLGYAVSGDKAFVSRLRAEVPIWSINSLAQFFLESLAEHGAAFAASCVQEMEATQALFRGLETVPFIEPLPTRGNYILCRTTGDVTGSEAAGRLFDEFNVLVNDCSGKEGLDSRYFRIASRTTEENEALVRILLAMADGTPAVDGASQGAKA
jgi:histidinol-phosphate/aromatic aminotransferase/cobyric acid decarboxylase-like protein